jgi:predicted ATPase/class 3 adenylate cyclase
MMRTLLFSDIEGSTSLLDRAGPKYRDMLAVHRRIVRAAVESVGGTEHSTEGDSFFLSFDSPTAAIAAAVASQREMENHEWPDGLRMRVRMGVHAGEVQETDDDDLLGMSINHAARIAAAAHGGQIVLSEAVRQMAHQLPDGVEVRSLGTHRLRDVGSIVLFQVEHPDLQHDFPPPRGAIGHRTNVPRIRTPFVGGDRLLQAIGEHLDAANLVTLTGTGGVGKTRAAIEYGLSRLDDFDQGVFFVDLAPVSDTGAVIGAIASTLPIIAGGDRLLLDTVVDWIGERRLLFIIDNCEHLVAEVGSLVEEMISRCPNVQILVTGREALGVRGERVHRVPSLEADGSAVELFCERVRAIDASFALEGHRDTVVQICERLDGIPLAIELAAARMRSLSAEELLERLRDRFRVLRGSGRGTLDRHQTLRAAVTWSYQLLSVEERVLFDRVSVFAGGFELQAAETVCGFDPLDVNDVIDLVSSLVDKSMIVADRRASGMRYRLLETLRQYAEEQLEVRGETLVVRDRHAEYYAELVAELDVLVRGERQLEGSQRISLEWDNVRAAHLWSLAQENLDLAERIAAATFLDSMFELRHEHALMLQRAVDLGEDSHAPSTTMLAMLSFWLDLQGNEEASRRVAQRGIDVAPSADDAATALCWFEFAGATAGTVAFSPAAVEAFRHQEAATANIADIAMEWHSLGCLLDASLNADPSATAALRQQLNDVASAVHSPRLTLFVHQYEGHFCMTASPPDFAGAFAAYERMGELASASGDLQFHLLALRGIAMAAVGLGAPDAPTRCHDALVALFEARYWQKTWQALESACLALAVAGRIGDAAVILGRLDVQSGGLGIEHALHFRDRARDLIEAGGGHESEKARGARMSPEELVTAGIGFCAGD